MKFSELPAFVQWTLFIASILLVFYGMCCLGATQYGRLILIVSAGALGTFHKLKFRSWSSPSGPRRYSRF